MSATQKLYRPSAKENREACANAEGALREYLDTIDRLALEPRPSSDRAAGYLAVLSERLVPQIDFTKYTILPGFEKIAGTLALMLHSEPRLEQILIVNVLSSLLNGVLRGGGGAYREYYMARLMQLAALGLQTRAVELKAAFLTFYFEVLEAAEGQRELRVALRRQLRASLYGLLATDAGAELLRGPTLFDCQQFQSPAFLAQAQNYPKYLELLSCQFPRQQVLSDAAALYALRTAPDAVFRANFAPFYERLLQDYVPEVQSVDEFRQLVAVVNDVVNHTRLTLRANDALSAAEYGSLVDVLRCSVSVLAQLQGLVRGGAEVVNAELVFGAAVAALKHDAVHKNEGLDKALQKVRGHLADYFNAIDLRQHIVPLLEQTDNLAYVLQNAFFAQNLLPLISYAVYERLGQHALVRARQQDRDLSRSQRVAENSAEHREMAAQTRALLAAVANLRRSDAGYCDYFMERMGEAYLVNVVVQYQDDPQQLEQLLQQDRLDLQCNLFYGVARTVLEHFGPRFFGREVYAYALGPADQCDQETVISGKCVFLCALRDHLGGGAKARGARLDLNYLQFLFEVKKDGPQDNIFTAVANLSQSLRQNISNVNNLVVALGILQVLLENAKQIVPFDYFAENRAMINQFINQILVKNLILVVMNNRANRDDFNRFLAAMQFDMVNPPEQNDALYLNNQLLAIQAENLRLFQGYTKFDTSNSTRTCQSQYFNIEDQAFAMLSFMVQMFDLQQIVTFEKENDRLSQIIYLIYLIIFNVQKFSQTLYKSAVVLLSYMSLNRYCLDKYLKRYFYNMDELNGNLNPLQIICNSVPMISVCQRVMANAYSHTSKISITPVLPIVSKESVNYTKALNSRINDLFLLISEKQVQGSSLVNEEFNRFIDLQYEKKDQNNQKQEIEVQNIIINPVDNELMDMIVILPLQLFISQCQSSKKLFITLNNQIIEQLFQIEPEIIINSINDYISYNLNSTNFDRRRILTTQLIQANRTSLQSQNMLTDATQTNDDVNKQLLLNKLMKLPTQQFSYSNNQVANTVIELNYQKMKRYFTSSQFNSLTVTVQKSLLDLTQFALQNDYSSIYYEVLFIVTEFSEKQLQQSLRDFGNLTVQRLKLFKDLEEPSILHRLYLFFLKSMKCFIDYDQIFVLESEHNNININTTVHQSLVNQRNDLYQENYLINYVSMDVLTDYFIFGVENLIKNDLSKIVEVMSLLISNCRKQNEMLLKLFLTMLNNYFKKLLPEQIQNEKHEYISLIGSLVNITSIEHYFVFLSQLLFVESTYSGEFKYLIQLLDCELYQQGIDLLFNICSVIQGNSIVKQLLNIDKLQGCVEETAVFDKLSQEIAATFFEHFQQQIMLDQLFYQKSFVALINRWNQEHITSLDVAAIFKLALERRNLIIIHILVKYRIYEMDLSYKDKILKLFEEIDIKEIAQSIQHPANAIINIIYVKFLQELCLQLSRVHDILVRNQAALIQQLLTNVVILCITNNQCLSYLSKSKAYYTDVFADQAETYGKLTSVNNLFYLPSMTNPPPLQSVDSKDLRYIYDFRPAYLVRNYITMLSAIVSKQTDVSFLSTLYIQLTTIAVKALQQNVFNQPSSNEQERTKSLGTIYAVLDLCCEMCVGLAESGRQISTEQIQYLEQITNVNMVDLICQTFDMAIKNEESMVRTPLLRRMLILLVMMQQDQNNDIEAFFGNFLNNYILSHKNLQDSIADSKQAFQTYLIQKKLVELVLLPIMGRVQLLQSKNINAQMPLLTEIFKFLRQNCLQLLEIEYQFNLSAAYYEAKLQASEVNNCRTMILPSFVLYIAQLKIIKPAEIECLDYQFEKLYETWSIDVSVQDQQWFRKISSLLNEEPNVHSVLQWYWRVQQLISEVLE